MGTRDEALGRWTLQLCSGKTGEFRGHWDKTEPGGPDSGGGRLLCEPYGCQHSSKLIHGTMPPVWWSWWQRSWRRPCFESHLPRTWADPPSGSNELRGSGGGLGADPSGPPTHLCLLYLLLLLLFFWPRGKWDLISPTGDWTSALGKESSESQSLNCQGIP